MSVNDEMVSVSDNGGFNVGGVRGRNLITKGNMSIDFLSNRKLNIQALI